ncbi:exodeoxyribonuclease III [Candidatus Legionella polyplacis]|uniref:exodeoxyribonuclease III n=1 Tax=Candidatus Legionella polyplacis TaxID=2005262 RepID=UPI000C1E76CE|nr:exodeoxyribonuclease III [Candidatus Legionella polyplacis]ATW01966.1 exodeoxyribonuclease III [Candidatus Legionella polyplacis]
MKIISFNVNGIRSVIKKGFFDWLYIQNADIICIQEVRVKIDRNRIFLPKESIYNFKDYFCTYFSAERNGYSGVAIFSRYKPKYVKFGLDYFLCDSEGRYLQFDYSKFSVASVYFPSGSSGSYRQEVKYKFLNNFLKFLLSFIKSGREIVFCGDFNIAHKKIDVRNWRDNQKKSGFLIEERKWMDKLFRDFNLVDAFRILNKNRDQYTWWSYRNFKSWIYNIGWRIDYQIITKGLANSVYSVNICKENRWSDHAPLVIEYNGNWFD